MPASEKKRELADFFKPYARARLFPAAGNVVPQKRPSPSPETENIPPPKPAKDSLNETPKKVRMRKDVQTPKQPSHPPVSLPRSGSLPIRSPHPQSSAKPAAVYKNARIFERRTSPPLSLPERETPSPDVRQDKFNFASVSQAPVSTQSVVRRGKLVAVRDSDEDHSDSLASLDEIFGTKRDDDTTSASSPPEFDDTNLESERRKVLSAFTFGRSEPLIGKGKLRALNAKEKANKIDISRFINDHLDDEEEQEKIQRFKDQYDTSVKTLESAKQDEVDAKLLASLVQKAGGDEDDIARLMGAVSRTEALSSTKTFSFFGPSGLRDLEAHPPKEIDFPHASQLRGLFKHYDDDARARAFSSGYMSELASAGHLPEEVLNWTFNSLLGEKDDHLRQAYLECLSNGASLWARTNLTAHNVQAMFEELGADPLNLKDSIQPRYQSLRQKAKLGLKYFVTVLSLYQAICQHMDFVALGSLVSIVCRITLDEGFMSNAAASAEVEELLQTLMTLPDKEAREHVTNCILNDMGQHLHASNLQTQLLTHLMPSSPPACSLRIKLALVFLLGPNSSSLPPDILSTDLLDSLTTYLTSSPHFDTSPRNVRTLNYAHLRACTSLLDIAISDGHRPPSFAVINDGGTTEPIFNASVDRLADAIKAKYTSISDSGASHMTRTEAKDALVAVYWRVMVAVRTKARVKRHVFDERGVMREGEAVRGEERGREMMKGFLAKVREKKVMGAEDVGGHGVEGSQRSGSEPMSIYASAREELVE